MEKEKYLIPLNTLYISVLGETEKIEYTDYSSFLSEKSENEFEKIGSFYSRILNDQATIRELFTILLELFDKEDDLNIKEFELQNIFTNFLKKMDNTFLEFYLNTILKELDNYINSKIQNENIINEIKRIEEQHMDIKINTDITEGYLKDFYTNKKVCSYIRNKISIDFSEFEKNIANINYYFNLGNKGKGINVNELNFFNNCSEMEYPKTKFYYCYKDKGKIIPIFYLYRELFKIKNEEEQEIFLRKKGVELDKPTKLMKFQIETFKELLDFLFLYTTTNNCNLYRCENCDRYFVQQNKNQKFCDYIFKDNLTCRQYAPKERFNNKEVTQKYNKMVNRYRSKILHCEKREKRGFEEELDTFKEIFSNKKSLIRKNKLSEKELLEWLDDEFKKYNKKYKVRIKK